jgi:hypothetical protein
MSSAISRAKLKNASPLECGALRAADRSVGRW